jgi:hypothetical protein
MNVNGVDIKSSRIVPIQTVQPDQLPALGVYIVSENSVMDGNVSIPQFVVRLELMIALTVMASDPVFIDGALDDFAGNVYNILLTDPTFLVMFEYVENVKRGFAFKKEGESYIAEIGVTFAVSYRSRYEPLAPNSLTMVDIKIAETDGTPIPEERIILTGA